MAPDPPIYPADENLSHNYDAALAMHNGDDSDSEVDEQPAYDGYTLLGQHEQLVGVPLADNDDVLENITDAGNENDGSDCPGAEGAPETPPSAGRAELVALWNSTPVEASSNSIAMDDERSAQIREAMAGFSLPPSAVPAWASNIPEELWKERIFDRLQQTKVDQKP